MIFDMHPVSVRSGLNTRGGSAVWTEIRPAAKWAGASYGLARRPDFRIWHEPDMARCPLSGVERKSYARIELFRL